jgi:hypothetical protein
MALRDIRYAVRSLVHDRAVSVVVIACLALGIGVNATLFSVVDGVLLQPLPFAEPDRIVVLNETFVRGGVDWSGLSYRNLQDWKERTTTLASIAAVSERNLAITDGAEAERFEGAAITWDMFPVLGIQPILGRHFNAADDHPGAERVVILSHEVWQRRYQGDSNIIDRSIAVNGRPHTVVAVMPPRFSFPENQKIWVPLGPLAQGEERNARYLFTFGRLKPGIDRQQASAEIKSIAEGINQQDPKTDGWSAFADSRPGASASSACAPRSAPAAAGW